MAKEGKAKVRPKNSVGIKELKDSASSIVDEVQHRRRAVTITKNGQVVARIVPIQADDRQKLEDLGLLLSGPREPWDTLDLYRLGLDASIAIESISSDREHR